MRSHRLRKERAEHAGKTVTLAYWDADGEHQRVGGKLISSGPTSVWVVTDNEVDVIVRHERVSAILAREATRV